MRGRWTSFPASEPLPASLDEVADQAEDQRDSDEKEQQERQAELLGSNLFQVVSKLL
jgi:hypothetical protein